MAMLSKEDTYLKSRGRLHPLQSSKQFSKRERSNHQARQQVPPLLLLCYESLKMALKGRVKILQPAMGPSQKSERQPLQQST